MKKAIIMCVVAIGILSCEDLIEVEDISGKTVEVLAPTEGATITNSSVSFNWEPVEDADQYRVQIAQPNFETATQILTDSVVTSTVFVKVLSSGSYEWRVRAENSGYETAYTSQQFMVATEPEDISSTQVTLLSPADGLVFGTSETINFSWEEVLGADSYTFQMATPSFQNAVEIIEDVTLTGNTYSASSLSVNDYEWRVKAVNSTSETAYTSNNFTVE